jgi:dGTPase
VRRQERTTHSSYVSLNIDKGPFSLERPDLASFAARSDRSMGRRYPEEFKDDRPNFERDRDRIIHSAAFRRLESKTQVFVNHEGDYYRTRLTHSLEVAQIAKGIARRLRLNEDLTESIALAHDLGHTPFGHTGEETLNELMKDHGGFEHNHQSLRIVEELEDKYPYFKGLNLTWETREGLIKHPPFPPKGEEDWLEYMPELSPTLEAQIIPLADEIAYINHDIDDGLEARFIELDALLGLELWREIYEKVARKYPGLDERKMKYQTISHLIGFLIEDLVVSTLTDIDSLGIKSLDHVKRTHRQIVTFSKETQRKMKALKAFLHKNLYRHYRVERMRIKAGRYVTLLFETYLKNSLLLPKRHQQRMEKEFKERVICDYIAGMTDRFALDEYKKLFEPYEKV